jgi:hypothetical protein
MNSPEIYKKRHTKLLRLQNERGTPGIANETRFNRKHTGSPDSPRQRDDRDGGSVPAGDEIGRGPTRRGGGNGTGRGRGRVKAA